MRDAGEVLYEPQDDGRDTIVGAVIRDERGRVLVLRRAWESTWFPGCWEIVGGHVDSGEDLRRALAREVAEETGFTLVGTPALLRVTDWQITTAEETHRRREFDFLVEVEETLRTPRLAPLEHVEFRWIGPHELDLLRENRAEDDDFIQRLVASVFAGTDA